MASIYDVAGNMQHAQPVTAYMQGVQYRNALMDLQQKRAEQARQTDIRNGLMQFYRQAQPEQVQTTAQGPGLMAMAQQGANMGPMGGLGVMRDAPKYMPRADYIGPQDGVLPTMQRQTIPAQPGGFDFQGAGDYLASKGDFESLGALERLRKMTQPQGLEWTGVIKDAEDAQGNPVLLGMTNQGPRPVEGYRPKPEAPKMPEAPKTRAIKVGGKEVSQEWNGSQWINVAEAPRETPSAPTAPAGYRFRSDGSLEAIPGGPAGGGGAGGEATVDERKSAASAMVMQGAEKDYFGVNSGNGLSTKGYFASKLPGGEALMSPEDQKAKQAMVNWYREKLRLESGATIGEDEAFQEAKRYFPVPGEDQQSINQKANARKVVMEGLMLKAGRAAKAMQPQGSGFSVQAPNGKTYSFPSQQAADDFRKKAGIR